MATYKEKVGTSVVNYAGTYPGAVDGELWYDSTNKNFNYQYPNVTTSGSWATTGSLNQARNQLASAGQAPRATSLVFNGFNNPTKYAQTELFNGSSWTELNDLNAGRAAAFGFGISTAAVTAGGYNGPPGDIAVTETWNGTNWTEVNDMNTGRYGGGSAGLLTGGLAFGGFSTPPSVRQAKTETWNGTNWTEVNDLNTAKNEGGSCGATNTAALQFGGTTGSITGTTESWNGTNWTEVNDLNTARIGLAGAGNYTSALAFGGGTPTLTGASEVWNGTNWTEEGDLNTARNYLTGGGTSNASAIAAGGQEPSNSSAVELWTGAGAALTRTFTDS